MMKIRSFVPLAAMLALSSCGNTGKQAANNNDTMLTNNPFANASALPFQAADFTKIKDSDFKPAIEEGIKQQQAEIQKIADNTEAPTFENTLVAMERSGLMLRRVSGVFGLLTSANSDSTLLKVSEL